LLPVLVSRENADDKHREFFNRTQTSRRISKYGKIKEHCFTRGQCFGHILEVMVQRDELKSWDYCSFSLDDLQQVRVKKRV
jgi:hypothetical protein